MASEPEEGKRKRRRPVVAEGLVPTPEQFSELLQEWKRLLAENRELRSQVAERPVTHISIQAVSNLTVVLSKETDVEQITNQIAGNVGNLAQGDKAQAISLGSINQVTAAEGTAYLAELSPALEKLLDAMEKEKSESEHEADIGMVKAAASAIKKNEPSKAADFLRKTSKWVLDVATKIGVPLAIEALKQAGALTR